MAAVKSAALTACCHRAADHVLVFVSVVHLLAQAVSTEQQIAALSPSKASGDLLSVVSSKGGIKAEVATILAAQQFFHEAAAPKRYTSSHWPQSGQLLTETNVILRLCQ